MEKIRGVVIVEELKPIVRLEHVGKTFKTKRQEICALEDITFTVYEHDFVSIVGPSGCGKSTIIRLIDDIIKPTSGDIYVEGYKYEKKVPKKVIRKMGFVFQRPNLLPWKTVRENIAFPQTILGLKGKEWDLIVEELIKRGRLEEYANKRTSELSGGATQRVGVLRSMSTKPDILLMDEPYGALNERLREQLDLETLEIWEKNRQTIIFITHNVREAVLLSNRILVMDTQPGRIISEVDIDLPYPRTLDTMITDKFIDYENQVTNLIGNIDLSTIK